MPEGPEAEICRRQLHRWWTGRQVTDVRLYDEACVRIKRSTSPRDALPDAANWLDASVVGQRWVDSERVGKRIGVQLSMSALLIHLGMTGRWIRSEQPEHRFCRLALRLDDAYWICFLDTRRFGGIVPATGSLHAALQEGLGPDAMTSPWTGPMLQQCIRGKRGIKVALMDQKNIAGLGNIHATEVLWKCHIHPHRSCATLEPTEWVRLAKEIPKHLLEVVERDDGDEMVYVSQGGENLFAVYGRKGGICPRCRDIIDAEKTQGRTSYFCKSCQVF